MIVVHVGIHNAKCVVDANAVPSVNVTIQ
jgi:hypothetical protein